MLGNSLPINSSVKRKATKGLKIDYETQAALKCHLSEPFSVSCVHHFQPEDSLARPRPSFSEWG